MTEPCACNVVTDQTKLATGAEWVASAMNHKGNLIFVTGVPGTSVDTDHRPRSLAKSEMGRPQREADVCLYRRTPESGPTLVGRNQPCATRYRVLLAAMQIDTAGRSAPSMSSGDVAFSVPEWNSSNSAMSGESMRACRSISVPLVRWIKRY